MRKKPKIHLARLDGKPFCGKPSMRTTDTEAIVTCGVCKERLITGGRLLPRKPT